jgi:hypothetical protein
LRDPHPLNPVIAAAPAASSNSKETVLLIRLAARRSLRAKGKSRMPHNIGGILPAGASSPRMLAVCTGTLKVSETSLKVVPAGSYHEVPLNRDH